MKLNRKYVSKFIYIDAYIYMCVYIEFWRCLPGSFFRLKQNPKKKKNKWIKGVIGWMHSVASAFWIIELTSDFPPVSTNTNLTSTLQSSFYLFDSNFRIAINLFFFSHARWSLFIHISPITVPIFLLNLFTFVETIFNRVSL